MKRSREGHIRKHGKRWIARLRYTDASGRRREKKRICPTEEMAKDAIREFSADCRMPTADCPTYTDLDAFYRSEYVHKAKFVGGRKVSGFRQDTKTVERYLDRALDYFGTRPLDAITYADLRDYKRTIENMPLVEGRDGPRSVSDTNHHLKRIRRLFKVAVEQQWLTVNPFEKGGPLIVESFEVERTRTLSPDEETRLLAACDNGYRRHLVPLIIFAIETGCRRGEILSLRWSAVNLTGRVIKIEALNTKTLKPRLVPISERLRTTLVKLRQNQLRPNSRVFQINDFKTGWRKACELASLDDLHFHDLRHTAITRMLKYIPAPLVKKISGHTTDRTFARYVNQTEADVREIALHMDQAVPLHVPLTNRKRA